MQMKGAGVFRPVPKPNTQLDGFVIFINLHNESVVCLLPCGWPWFIERRYRLLISRGNDLDVAQGQDLASRFNGRRQRAGLCLKLAAVPRKLFFQESVLVFRRGSNIFAPLQQSKKRRDISALRVKPTNPSSVYFGELQTPRKETASSHR